jgi:hypothetical protein
MLTDNVSHFNHSDVIFKLDSTVELLEKLVGGEVFVGGILPGAHQLDLLDIFAFDSF